MRNEFIEDMVYDARRRELCARLQRWRNWGALNEEATILGLVLPVLEAAGYDTHDPEQVYPQPRDSQGKYPDLMLYKTSPVDGGVEWCVIEAKKLAETLDKFVSQIGQYLPSSEARWYVLTNGAEWRFYDRHRGESKFHCITLTLETPGALDALCCMFRRSLSEPDLNGAFRALIEAQLQAIASQTSWENHCLAWRLTRTLVYSLREATDALKEQFPEHAHLVEAWQSEFKRCLEQGAPPPWWTGTETQPEPENDTAIQAVAQPAPEAQETVSFAELKQLEFPVKNKQPRKLIVNSNQVEVWSWASLLIELIRLMDAHECLPKPPFIPLWIAPLYTTSCEGLVKYTTIESKMYGTLYINQHSHTDSRNRAQVAYELLRNSTCPDISPDRVYVAIA